MSAHKTKGAVAVSSGIVVGDGKHRRRLWLRVAGLSLAVVLVVGGGSFGIYKLVHKNTAPKQSSQQPTPEQLANIGNYSGAQAQLEEQKKSAATKQAQADVDAQQATLALNANKYDQAKTYADQAEKLAPSSGTAYMLGYIAELTNDKKTAQTYLQLAIDRLDKSKPQYQLTLRSYQNELQKVSQ